MTTSLFRDHVLVPTAFVAARPRPSAELEAAVEAVIEAAKRPLRIHSVGVMDRCRICDGFSNKHAPGCAIARLDALMETK